MRMKEDGADDIDDGADGANDVSHVSSGLTVCECSRLLFLSHFGRSV